MQKFTGNLKVIKVLPLEINVYEGREYKKRRVICRDNDDSAYPEDYEIEFLAQIWMDQCDQLGPNDLVDFGFIICGKHTAKPGSPEKVWMRLHGLNFEITKKAVMSAGTMQAGAATQTNAQQPQTNTAPPSNLANTQQPAGFTSGSGPANNLPF